MSVQTLGRRVKSSAPVPLSAVALGVPAVIVYLVQALGQHPLFIDDSYIFYRYATNWANGQGPVFNPGEHVEGFSSLLWTGLLALGAKLSIEPHVLGPILGLALGAISLLLIAWLAKALIPDNLLLQVAVPIATALSTGFAAFAISGMDTALFVLLLLCAVAGAIRAIESGHTEVLVVSLALLVFTRAEGVLYAAALLVALGLLRRADQPALSSRSLQVAALVTGMCFLLQVAGRLLYYGEFLPATVSAKGYATGGVIALVESGFVRWWQLGDALFQGFKYERAIIVMAAFPLAALALRPPAPGEKTAIAWIIAAPIVVNLGVTAWSAGDWMPFQRLNLAVLPLILLLIAWELTRLLASAAAEPSRAAPRFAFVRPLIVGLVVILIGAYSLERTLARPAIANVTHPQEQGFSLYSRQLGERLSQSESPAALLTDVVGKVGYYAGDHTYIWDMLGLTDEHNATSGERWRPRIGRSDDDYNFSRPFDVLMTDNLAVLDQALQYWQVHPESGGGAGYEMLPNPDWLQAQFYLLVRKDHPIALAMESDCACMPVPLTTGFVRDHRTRLDRP